MYAPSYGFGPGSNSQPFNPNGAPPQPHAPHQQPQQQQQQPQPQQQHQQQPQHMMYNPQQYAAGPHQSPYGAPGPAMGGNAGGMGMMQNSGLAHMAGGHVASYQTPYSSSPYGSNIPVSSSGQLPPNYMPATSNATSFAMNTSNMNPQQMQAQRMQPPPQSSTPTQPGQRSSPYGAMPHNTPPNAASKQSQFSTPQNPTQTHQQTPNNNQQNQGGTVVTPQTPNFPPGSQGGGNAGMPTPLSPGSEVREKERVTLLLEINRELLMEVMRLQAAQNAEKLAEKKEDASANANSPEAGDKIEKDKADKLKSMTSGREYVECMRRLQSNLAYLAAIADRSHKPSSQIPAHPAVMTAPPLTPRSAKKPDASSPSFETKSENEEKKSTEEDTGEDRIELLKDQYKRLQALFPGVDPKKDAAMQNSSAAARAHMQAKQQQAQAQAQGGQNQGQGGGDANQQQKLQNDLLRQKMMQQAQQQAQAQAHAQQQQGMHQGQGQMQNR